MKDVKTDEKKDQNTDNFSNNSEISDKPVKKEKNIDIY